MGTANIRITEGRVREIVKEEIRRVLSEANPFHDSKGRLSDDSFGHVYSITKKASKKYGNEAKKGKMGANGRLGYKFGMPNCGRRDIEGNDQTPRKSRKDFPRPYYQKAVSEGLGLSVDTEIQIDGDELCFSINDIKQAFVRRVEEAQQAPGSSQEATRCRQLGFTTFQDLLNSLNSATLAAKGELYKQPKYGK